MAKLLPSLTDSEHSSFLQEHQQEIPLHPKSCSFSLSREWMSSSAESRGDSGTVEDPPIGTEGLHHSAGLRKQSPEGTKSRNLCLAHPPFTEVDQYAGLFIKTQLSSLAKFP